MRRLRPVGEVLEAGQRSSDGVESSAVSKLATPLGAFDRRKRSKLSSPRVAALEFLDGAPG